MRGQDLDPTVRALFEFTRGKISEREIIDYSPGDPGYLNYVSLWTEIHRSGEIPQRVQPDLAEVIALTGWAEPENYSEPERFRRYRRFTSAVGVALLHYGHGDGVVRPANYIARDLIVDLDRESDGGRYLRLLRNVFPPTRNVLAASRWENEYPFWTLGTIYLAQLDGNWQAAHAAAGQLIKDDSDVRHSDVLGSMVVDNRFVFGLSNYDQLHGDWSTIAGGLRNPHGDENTQLIIDAFADGWDWAGFWPGGSNPLASTKEANSYRVHRRLGILPSS